MEYYESAKLSIEEFKIITGSEIDQKQAELTIDTIYKISKIIFEIYNKENHE